MMMLKHSNYLTRVGLIQLGEREIDGSQSERGKWDFWLKECQNVRLRAHSSLELRSVFSKEEGRNGQSEDMMITRSTCPSLYFTNLTTISLSLPLRLLFRLITP